MYPILQLARLLRKVEYTNNKSEGFIMQVPPMQKYTLDMIHAADLHLVRLLDWRSL